MTSGRKFSIRGRKESQGSSSKAAMRERRPRTIEEHTERGMRAYRATKFAKKIDGHTMFNQDKDMEMWRDPWKFMYDIMIPANAESSFEHREF